MQDHQGIDSSIQQDINNIEQIHIIPSLLDVVCKTTGMGFAAIARVTEDEWVTCSVKDDILFGLKPGSQLELKTTICNEVRNLNKAVIIEHVADDPDFRDHHTPAMYGFQSYISVPIIRTDGRFFGTLCAIDPKPNVLKTPEVIGMFNLFAELISFHLNAVEERNLHELTIHKERQLHEASEEQHRHFTEELERQVEERTQELIRKNQTLEKINAELNSFTYVASHDLQEPLRKIRIFAERILRNDVENLSEKGKQDFNRIQNAAERMQTLISDLIAYPQSNMDERDFQLVDINEILNEVKAEFSEELEQKNALITVENSATLRVIPFQFKQLLYNLVGNSLKFANPGAPPLIKISLNAADRQHLSRKFSQDPADYCHIRISDNGIGFEQEFSERIFKIFQRLHGKTQYSGTGIGLAIVKKIVENHKGYIFANSSLNAGATFDIFIPY